MAQRFVLETSDREYSLQEQVPEVQDVPHEIVCGNPLPENNFDTWCSPNSIIDSLIRECVYFYW